MKKLDVVFRGATLYDGSGADPVVADVGVEDGRIVAVGAISREALQVVDASGLALMPGIVDIHTHYDAQVTWDPTCSPSPALGVTTAVIGNCGFGVAPCPADLRDVVLRNLSVVEGMDLESLRSGMRWEFESFAEYMDLLRRLKPTLNVAVFAGHSTIRSSVMGADASTRAEPTAQELEAMKGRVRDAMSAGAVGFASSFSPSHSGYGGLPMPSLLSTDHELHELVRELGKAGKGVFMSATGPRATPDYMEKIAAEIRRPVFISTVLAMYCDEAPTRGLSMYDRCAEALDRGHELYIQTGCQPIIFDFDFNVPYPFYGQAAFDAVKAANGDREVLRGLYAGQALRDAFREELKAPASGVVFRGDWTQVGVLRAVKPGNAALEDRSIDQLAKEAGKDPVDWLFDFVLTEDMNTTLYGKFYNNSDEGVAPLLKHRAGVLALSDAGAHLTYMCHAGFGPHLLGHWVREMGTFTLQEAVRRLTSHPAQLYRIPQRGRIAPGYWADLLLFDPDTIGISEARLVNDFPGGTSRLVRDGNGIHGVWVNGQCAFDGKQYNPGGERSGHVLDHFPDERLSA